MPLTIGRLFVIAALAVPARLAAQDTSPQCPTSEAHRFDFLVGDWHGREFLIKTPTDSMRDDDLVAHTKKLPFGCAYEETWEFTPRAGSVVRSVVLRAFDLPSNSWKYSLADNFVELATFDGVRADSGWAFIHMLTIPVPHRLLRAVWLPTAAGYTEIFRVSTDSGRTWSVERHMNYVRDRTS